MIFLERRWPDVSSIVVMLRSLGRAVSGGERGWEPHVHGLRLMRRLNSPLLTGWMSPKPRQSMARPPRAWPARSGRGAKTGDVVLLRVYARCERHMRLVSQQEATEGEVSEEEEDEGE